MSVTDDRQTTDGRATAYREENVNMSSRSLETNIVVARVRFFVNRAERLMRTELKRCIKIDRRWNKNGVLRGSPDDAGRPYTRSPDQTR